MFELKERPPRGFVPAFQRRVSYASRFVSGCVSGQFCTRYCNVVLNHLNQSCRSRQDCIFIGVVPCELFEMSGNMDIQQGRNSLCRAALNLDKILIRILHNISRCGLQQLRLLTYICVPYLLYSECLTLDELIDKSFEERLA